MSFWKANDLYSATLSSGFTVGQTTLSVTTVPDNVPTLVCVAQGTSKETIFIVTGKTTNSLTGVSRLKGYNGDLDSGMPITCINNQEFINQYSAAVSTPESLIQILYGVDGGSTDAYDVSLDVAPTAYTAGLCIQFKANTANTGACTLNLNSLGAKAIKVDGTLDIATGDIQAGQIVTVIYDGTNFQLTSHKNKSSINVATDEATVTFDISKGNTQVVTITDNRTLAVSNAVIGQYFAVEIIQGGAGSKTVTWFSTIKWVGNTAPTLTTTAGKKDTFMFRVTDSGTYDGYIVGMNI